MAMMAGAPRNGWGMVGAWPDLRIASVRAMPTGSESFPFDDYRQAIQACRRLRDDLGHPIKVINLSLGGATTPSSSELQFLNDSVNEARRVGINVIAAGGNEYGGVVNYPAALQPIFAVGASDLSGAYCPISSQGAGLDLLAPGCNLETAFPDGSPSFSQGTSNASVFASAVLAALRAYRPDLTPDQAEAYLMDNRDRGASLNVEAAFRAAGLSGIVEAGIANTPRPSGGSSSDHQRGGGGDSGGGDSTPAPTTAPGADAAPLGGGPTVQLSTPRSRMQLRRGRITVRVANRPPGARVVISLLRGGDEFRSRRVGGRTAASSVISLRGPRFDRLTVQFIGDNGQRSSVQTLRASRRRR